MSGLEISACMSRIIQAPRQTLYAAFVDPDRVVSWLPPKGMTGRVFEWDARVGGSYRMALTYLEPDHSTPGKTSEHIDISKGRFLELIPGPTDRAIGRIRIGRPGIRRRDDYRMDPGQCPRRHRGHRSVRRRTRCHKGRGSPQGRVQLILGELSCVRRGVTRLVRYLCDKSQNQHLNENEAAR
jgi:hypothetical protein